MNSELTIVIDSREKKPFNFAPTPIVVRELRTGDYSLIGFEQCISVERKSLPDLIDCCVPPNRSRFQRELVRLARIQRRIVIVEGPWSGLQLSQNRFGLSGEEIMRVVIGWMAFFHVQFLFACCRSLAESACREFLIESANEWNESRDTTEGCHAHRRA